MRWKCHKASYTYVPAGDLIAKHTYTNGTDIITEMYAYDMLGNRTSTTDALGNTIFKSYDAVGNVITEDGATYPVRYTYDTAGRRTSLSSTRDGTIWDTTTWTYDPCTSLCTSKTYADNSTVTYTYTPDNLPLRTTYASGRWKENVYDERRKVVGVEFSDAETVSLAYDAFLNEIAFSNDVAAAILDRDAKGNCTNDTAAVGEEMKTTRRTFDAFSRLTGIDGTFYDYNADGLLASISNAIAVVEYAYTPDRLDAGYSLTLSNGVVFTRSLVRDCYRRSLVTGISSVANGVGVGTLAYTYDALNRPATRNNDTFGYNERGEVVFSRRGAENAEESYSYDDIGNLLLSAFNTATNAYTANNLNQYTSILRASASPREMVHDADGNMLSDGNLSFTYDAANRLKTVSSNGVLLVTNFYDAKSRRVKKVTPEATTTFFYDGWNLIEERIAYTNGTTSTIRYYWGKDLSGTLQGAGGVGGLLYLTIDGVPYVPNYDNIGNITRYLDANGNTVAQYTYDAFGGTLSQSGSLASFFRHRFSTKYFDVETGLYYCDYRFYFPPLMRWFSRDPIEEDGGVNLYCFCLNNTLSRVDALGQSSISDYVLANIGYDRSFPILGPYGLPVPALAARLQIQIYISGHYAECCKDGKKKKYAKGTIGAEAYLTWGAGTSRQIKGRDRNNPDPYRPGSKMKDNFTNPPDSGYRSRSWHVDGALQNTSCPESGLHFSGLTGVIFLRGSAGYGAGVQVNIQKEFRAGVDLSEGWSASLSGAWNVWGATIDFGGGGSGTWTYLQD